MDLLYASYKVISQMVSSIYDELSRLCYPIFKKTSVQYYRYQKLYNAGGVLYLSKRADLLPKWCNNELYPISEELNLFSSFDVKKTSVSQYIPLPLGSRVVQVKYENLICLSAEKFVEVWDANK